MQERLRMDVLIELSNKISKEQLDIVDRVLSKVIGNYEISERCTDIVPYDGGIPIEVKSFLVCKSMVGLRETSLKHYKRTLEHFALNINKDVKNATTNDIRIYLINYEQINKCGKSTLDDKRRVLSSFYVWLTREELVDKNPMLKIDAIKCSKKVREPLSQMELEQIRNVCETNRERAILELLYSTGCRVSEIIALNKRDLNYETGMVKVVGKGNKERMCFINAKAQVAIKKYLFSRNDENEALFAATKVPFKRLGKGTIEKEIKQLGIRANINRDVFPHLIRHTTATHMLQNGADLGDVQMLLGHESSETTLIYAKTNIQKLQTVHKRCVI